MRKRVTPRLTAQAAAPGSYWTGGHTRHRLRLHLVWIPKYRRRVLEEPLATRLTQLLRQACEVKAWGLIEINVQPDLEINVQPDPVHLLVQVSPSEAIADVVNLLKGGTARRLRVEFPELEEFLYAPEGITSYAGDSFWSDGYFHAWLLPRRSGRPRKQSCATTSVCRGSRARFGKSTNVCPDGRRTKPRINIGTFRV